MKRIFVIISTLVVLLGISDVAFAKHQHNYKAQDNKNDVGRKVPCLINGVQQMVRTENVCKDFNGTIVTPKTSQVVTAVPKGKITTQKIQSE